MFCRAAAVFAQDQREAAERLVRETAERKAAERAHAAYERAQRARRPNGWMRRAGHPNGAATNNSRAEREAKERRARSPAATATHAGLVEDCGGQRTDARGAAMTIADEGV